MTTHFQRIDGNIKYISIIDRDNYPILSFNLSSQEEELSYQLMVFSSIDIIESKEKAIPSKSKDQPTDLIQSDPNNLPIKECITLLMKFHELNSDYGSFSYGGSNGIKILLIKQMTKHETKEHISKLNAISRELHERFIVLLLNPFYDRREFYANNSSLKATFSNDLLSYITQNQID